MADLHIESNGIIQNSEKTIKGSLQNEKDGGMYILPCTFYQNALRASRVND